MVGAGRLPDLGRRVSRRGVVGLVGRLGVGWAALAGLQLAPSKKVNAADDGSAVDGTLGVSADERPISPGSVEVRYWTDHLSGPRGSALGWGLNRFAQLNPRINLRIEPATTDVPTPPLRQNRVSHAHAALVSQTDSVRYRGTGHFMRINDLLPKFGRAQ